MTAEARTPVEASAQAAVTTGGPGAVEAGGYVAVNAAVHAAVRPSVPAAVEAGAVRPSGRRSAARRGSGQAGGDVEQRRASVKAGAWRP
jgi:hypothetical protein